MKNLKRFRRAFGIDEFSFPKLPTKFSNIKISRIDNFIERGGCPYCFPHGIETDNSTWGNLQKNWKKYRKKQYKNCNKTDWNVDIRKARLKRKIFSVTNINFDKIVLNTSESSSVG